MYTTIKTMKCYNKKKELQNSLQIFQKGILMSITSLKALREEMQRKFGFKFILTHRLNQDCLENFFTQMRRRNGQDDHPTPTQCLYNLKAIILGKNPGLSAHMHCNTYERDPEQYASAMFYKVLNDTEPFYDLTEEFLDEEPDDLIESLDYNSDDGPEEFLQDVDETAVENDDDEREADITNETVEERIIDLCVEFVDDANNTSTNYADEITLEFINDLFTAEMEVGKSKPTYSEDGLGTNLFIVLLTLKYIA